MNSSQLISLSIQKANPKVILIYRLHTCFLNVETDSKLKGFFNSDSEITESMGIVLF
jgi:hypothetical protein